MASEEVKFLDELPDEAATAPKVDEVAAETVSEPTVEEKMADVKVKAKRTYTRRPKVVAEAEPEDEVEAAPVKKLNPKLARLAKNRG